MNAIVQHQPQASNAAPSFSMSDMERVALAIAKGGLFGSTDPNAVLTLCMLAQAEGQHPAVVFRDYHMISGKPAKKAEAMQRDFMLAGGKIQWHKLEDDECSATFSHPQGGSATISWDKARVAQAELGGNKMHKKYPRQMLRSRVISEGVRTVFPMATSGLYEVGEVADFDDAPRADIPPTPTAKRARDLPAIEAPRDEAPAEESETELIPSDPATKFANAYIAKLATLEAMPALDSFVMERKGKLDELQAKRPELYDKVSAAIADRIVELADAPVDDEVDA